MTAYRDDIVDNQLNIKETLFNIGGMKCASCASIIVNSIKKIKGVINCEVNYATDSCKIEYNPREISIKTIVKKIQELGYTVNEAFGDKEFKKSQKSTLMNFGIAAFLSMNIMMLTVPVYWNYFEDVELDIVNLFGWLMFFLCIPVLFVNGLGVLKKAFSGIIKKSPGMETLIGIGALSAFLYSTIELIFSPNPHLYFDTAATLIVIILFGKYVENHFKYKASTEINKLYYILPRKIRTRDIMHNVNWIPSENLKENDVFEVHAGEIIPADGVVVNGSAIVDESIFTGEAKGVRKDVNSIVISGCVLKNGFLQIRANTSVNSSVLSTIVKMIQNALNKKSNVQNFGDKIAAYFIPTILLISFITLIVMLFQGFTFEKSFLRSLTVLVIACPCALAIALPVSFVTAFGTLAKNGIFVRNPEILIELNKITDIVFDKTGTLTYGKFEVNEFKLVNTELNGSEKIEEKLYLLETFSSHPTAEAIKDFLSNKFNGKANSKLNIDSVMVHNFGVSGKIDFEDWSIGNEKMFEFNPHAIQKSDENNSIDSNTMVFFGRNKSIEGYFLIGDSSRENITQMVNDLKVEKKNIHLLSGDKISTTKNFAVSVGIDIYHGEKSPHEKIQYIKNLKNENRKVMMIGDGINDAAALAESDVGVAISSGTDLAKSSASMMIFKNFLNKLPELFDYSSRLKNITIQNFIWAIVYNIIGISLAVAGFLNPLIAAVMMMLSSITVVLNSLRLVKF